MAVFYDEIPESLFEWIKKQQMFWVATAPLSAQGHINLSPKGGEDCFHIVNSKRVYYQDLSGSGVETISHIRENGRITVMFHAFEGPPRILRLFGVGTVYEYGTPEYHTLIPAETRRPGSRAAIVIDVYQVGTSCGFAVPLYNFVTHRTQLLRLAALREKADRDNPLAPCDNPGSQVDPPPNSIRAYWLRKNMKSLDGLPGLLTAPDAIAYIIPQNNFDKDTPRPTLDVVKGNDKNRCDAIVKDYEKVLALGFLLGAITVTAFTQIISKMNCW